MTAGASFSGFTESRPDPTPIPSGFFADLLPEIDHLGELKLTLFALWALARRPAGARYLRVQDLADDPLLLRALGGEAALEEAMERCVARGTLLRVQPEDGERGPAFYFLNSPKGRAAAEALVRGEWSPGESEEAPLSLSLDRPNVFTLYEQNIGPLTPMIADQLRDADRTYPAIWIEEAMRIAVANNVRKWSYIQAILNDWERNGRDVREDRGDSEKARRRYLEGKLADDADS